MAEPVEMPFGRLTHVAPKEPYIRFGQDPLAGRGTSWGFPPIEKHWESAAVYSAKGIIGSSITHDSGTAAADCNAPNWSMSHYIVPRA